MKIVSAEACTDAIALKTPFVTALRRVDSVRYIDLKLQTDTGLAAFGSAPATKEITGETLESITHTLHEQIIPLVLNNPFELDILLRALHNIPGNSSARAAMDMALYSLAAQQADLPLYRFLGGTSPRTIKTAVTVSLDTPERMRIQAEALFNSGYDILKVKVGADDGADAERVRSIASALPKAVLLVDANQGWNVGETLQFLDEIHALDIALIEQPVAADDLAGLRTVRERSPFPILADEAVFDAEDAKRVLGEGCADLVNIKLMKSGGISGAMKLLDVCREHRVSCMLGSMLEGPASITAALHLANAHPERFSWFDLDSPLLYRTLPGNLPFSIAENRYLLHEH